MRAISFALYSFRRDSAAVLNAFCRNTTFLFYWTVNEEVKCFSTD